MGQTDTFQSIQTFRSKRFCSLPDEITCEVCSVCSAKLNRNSILAKRFPKFSTNLSVLKEINFKNKLFNLKCLYTIQGIF